ncbi:MAG TPA: methyltransferase domain-containing protein [Chloroflexi bacterium]|jgi:ubiquinone/menaquinone biosynthesis C-methylase UbiE|nr:methyltransferase domain-containing protein [Chloroflexota bacterium]
MRAVEPINPFEHPAVAAAYDGWYATPLGQVSDRLEKALVYRLAAPRPGERALDVGTGTGHWACDLAARGLTVVGIDASEAMLQAARVKDCRVTWRHGDVEELPFPDGAFDLVLSVTVLEFVRDPVRVLSEMARVTAPGGRIVVGVLNARSSWARARTREAQQRGGPFASARFFAPDEFVQLLRRYGPTEWSSSVFIGPSGRGLLVADLLESLGQRFARGHGALLVGRVER